jgi:hypothetical protein
MGREDKRSIIDQLKQIVRKFLCHELLYIGRPGYQPGVLPMGHSNVAFGPFRTENEYNEFCLTTVRTALGALKISPWRSLLRSIPFSAMDSITTPVRTTAAPL